MRFKNRDLKLRGINSSSNLSKPCNQYKQAISTNSNLNEICVTLLCMSYFLYFNNKLSVPSYHNLCNCGMCRRVSDPLPSDGVSEGVGSATFRRGVGVGVPTPQDRFFGSRRVSDPLPSNRVFSNSWCWRVSVPTLSDSKIFRGELP